MTYPVLCLRPEADFARVDALPPPSLQVAYHAPDNPKLAEFEASCFDGRYITGDVTADYLSQLAALRARLGNDPGAELRTTGEELRKITLLRLEKLLTGA